MSLRYKFMLSLLAISLMSIALVGFISYRHLTVKFDGMVLERSARNFRGDVTSYWMTYGSWEEGQRWESFMHFMHRRAESLNPGKLPFDIGSPRALREKNTGDGLEAQHLPRWVPDGTEADGQPQPGAQRQPPPFRFLLFNPEGRVLNPQRDVGRQASPDERQHSIPITIDGRIVAFASPIGQMNYTDVDRGYLDAVRESMIWGGVAAVAMAVALGLFVGNHMSSSLRKLTTAIQEIRAGRIRQQVKITSNDEVGSLARAFNAMSEDLALSREQLEASNRIISMQSERLREQATRDALTELHNRRHFDERVAQQFDLARRHDKRLAIAIADIDYFKRINDTFSHKIGDAVLREIGKLLLAQTRTSDLVARYGGEEFVFAFPETPLEEAFDVCERLRETIERHPWQALHPDLKVTISIGISDDLTLGSASDMIEAADRLLYKAKSEGRNRVCGSALMMPDAGLVQRAVGID